jgi:hypothetical protein
MHPGSAFLLSAAAHTSARRARIRTGRFFFSAASPFTPTARRRSVTTPPVCLSCRPTARWSFFARAPPAAKPSVAFGSPHQETQANRSMTQKQLPPDYDVGFLRLHSDGAVTATFPITRVFAATSTLEFRADRQRGTLSISGGENGTAGLPATLEELETVLPDFQGDTCVVFPPGVERAVASNATTGFRLHRQNGLSLLQIWRSACERFFVHEGTIDPCLAKDRVTRVVWHRRKTNVEGVGLCSVA